MTTIQIRGRIMPQAYVLVTNGLPKFQTVEPSLNLTINFVVNLSNEGYTVDCEVEPYEESRLSLYVAKAHELVRAIVDMYSFANGLGLTCYTETCTGPDGISLPILPEKPSLRGLGTAVDLAGSAPEILKTLLLLTADSQIFMALNDLIVAITIPRIAPINCGRSVEAIRNVMTPQGIDRAGGWAIMRDRLNLDKTYIQMVTEASIPGRHGDRTWQNDLQVAEVLKRSWIIMNRFIEYKKRGNIKLSVSEFPVLL